MWRSNGRSVVSHMKLRSNQSTRLGEKAISASADTDKSSSTAGWKARRLNNRFAILAASDALIWAAALTFATFSAYAFSWARVDFNRLVIAISIVVTVQLVFGFISGLYYGRWLVGSFDEVRWLAVSAALASSTLFAVVVYAPDPHLVPLSAALAGGSFQLIGAMASRYLARLVLQLRRRSNHERSQRLLIFGAGEAGSELVRTILEDPETDLLPVAFLDDDRARANLRICGLRVVGNRHLIGEAAEKYQATTLLIAMPSAPRSEVSAVADLALAAGLSVRILPRLDHYLSHPIRVRDIRDMTLADFLERDEIALDVEQIAGYLSGKKVLVTGAGGSIGSQLCETVIQFEPGDLLMLDRDENALHALQMKLEGRALLDSPGLLLADIRDREAVSALIAEHRPDVVFHAAAHKHVTFLERFPAEAVKTNVQGTLNLLIASQEADVERFVNISTDKAADPANVLGASKRVAEMLTAHFGEQDGGSFISVRFGNVLGSNGSVIPILRDQIARGEKLTITHPDVSRYFMTVEEAVQLVLQAGAVGNTGEVLVLDMGEPVRIVDLARRLASEIDPSRVPEFEFTGLRPGEKLEEVLYSDKDAALGRPHQLIMSFLPPSLEPERLVHLSQKTNAAEIPGVLRDLVESGSFTLDAELRAQDLYA